MECVYCSEHPIQIAPEDFSLLHYLPLPLLDDSKTAYLPFEEVYGKEPSDKDRPSSKSTSNSEAAEVDAKHKALLKNTKVRQLIFCEECLKPRCIYAVSRLSKEEEIIIERVRETKTYTCGSVLFPPDSPLRDTIIVRQNWLCRSH